MTQLQLAFPSLMGKTVFDDFFRTSAESFLNRSTTGFPVTDIYKSDAGTTIIEMALAGYTKEDLSIETENNKVTISASASASNHDTERRIARRSFKKSFINYDNLLDLNDISATFSDGLLRVKIPTKAEAAKKIIAIE